MEKVAREVAEAEFNRFAAAWDICTDTSGMSEDDIQSLDMHKGRIVRKIMDGTATVEDDGNITYKLQHPSGEVTSLTFRVPSGAAYMAMDRHKEGQNVHKLNAFMGSMTKQPPQLFANMDARDVKFCQGVAALFLGS